MEPTSSEASMCQSTLPMIQWPTPATRVSGTAWAMSVATMRMHGQAGIEQHQHGDAEGAGADRGDGDEDAERRAEGDGDGKAQPWRQFAMIAGKPEEASAEDQRQRGDQQHGAQKHRQRVRKGGIGSAGFRDEIERDGGGSDAAQGESADNGPIDVAVEPVHGGASGLGRGRVEQVGAHGGRRMDIEQQDEQGRHQRATADAGEADDDADGKAGKAVKRVNHPHRLSIASAARGAN